MQRNQLIVFNYCVERVFSLWFLTLLAMDVCVLTRPSTADVTTIHTDITDTTVFNAVSSINTSHSNNTIATTTNLFTTNDNSFPITDSTNDSNETTTATTITIEPTSHSDVTSSNDSTSSNTNIPETIQAITTNTNIVPSVTDYNNLTNITNSTSATNSNVPYTAITATTAGTIKTTSTVSRTTSRPTTSISHRRSSAADVPNNGSTYAISECQRLHASKASSLVNVTWWNGADNTSDWATLNRTSPEGRELVIVLRFYALATVTETREWTTLCVGVSHMEVHSYEDNSSTPAVSIQLQTRWDVAVGIVRLRSRCWQLNEHFSECSPSFTPLQYFTKLPLFHNSPLEEAFWVNFSSDATEIKSLEIRSVDITTFQGSIPFNWIEDMNMSSLEYLYITGNDWKTNNITLPSLPKMILLDLSDNNLQFLPEGIFSNVTNLEVVILRKNNIYKCPSSIYLLKKLFLLDLSHSQGNAILKFEEQELKNMPRSLRTLDLSHTKLEINLGNFVLLPELLYLNISGCNINVSKQHIPIETDKLMIINVSSNHLIGIPSDPSIGILLIREGNYYLIPDFPIDNLYTPLLVTNNFHIFLAQNTTINLQKLEVLDLSMCMLEYIFQPIFSNAFSLKYVNLSHNLLTFIPDSLFSSLLNLQEVDISHNSIKTVSLWEWTLRKLDFSSNMIIDISANMSAIEYLDLSFNNVQNIDIALSSVQKLNISYNSFSYISTELWENISQTLEVDLGGNDFVCCLFENVSFINTKQKTEILNLRNLEPLKCSTNSSNLLKIPFTSLKYDDCHFSQEPVFFSVLTITVVTVIVFAAVAAALALHILQTRQRKFVIQHPTNSRETIISS